jgi:hypothetical protein
MLGSNPGPLAVRRSSNYARSHPPLELIRKRLALDPIGGTPTEYRDITEGVYLPPQLERTLQLCSDGNRLKGGGRAPPIFPSM